MLHRMAVWRAVDALQNAAVLATSTAGRLSDTRVRMASCEQRISITVLQ